MGCEEERAAVPHAGAAEPAGERAPQARSGYLGDRPCLPGRDRLAKRRLALASLREAPRLARAALLLDPPQHVLDATVGQGRAIIHDTDAPFNEMSWRAHLRKLDRDAPDYKT